VVLHVIILSSEVCHPVGGAGGGTPGQRWYWEWVHGYGNGRASSGMTKDRRPDGLALSPGPVVYGHPVPYMCRNCIVAVVITGKHAVN